MDCNTKQIEILIVGLGNELLTDDGVGVHVARRLLCEPLPEEVVVAEVGTAILHAHYMLERAAYVIAVDAVRAGDVPGAIYCFDIDQAQVDKPVSLHELGIAGALKLMPESIRPKAMVVGVEPQKIGFDLKLSRPVQAAVPHVIEIVKKMIDGILSGETDPIAKLMTTLAVV